MKRRPTTALLALALVCPGATRAFAQSAPPPPPEPPGAQTPAPAPPAAPDDDDRVVQLSVTLVQVDAVVTDKSGRQVTDLRPEDFEVLEDGEPQAITDFSYVSAATGAPPPAPKPGAAPAGPAVRLRPEQVRRTIVLVVDALGFEDFHFARRAMQKFVEEQMQPGDLVSIVQVRAGARAFQTFTSDRRELAAAIERVRWSPSFLTSDAPLDRDPDAPCDGLGAKKDSPLARGRQGLAAPEAPVLVDTSEAFRGEAFTRGTLGVLNSVAKGLEDMPGRKAVILLSAGFPVDLGRCDYSIERSLRGLVDTANRASVGIYTVDVRGLQPLQIDASDSVGIGDVTQLLANRRANFFQSQDILSYLARQSGGTFAHNTNDLAGAIRRAADDQNGYYLIGYRPDESTFAGKDGRREFHKLSVRVKRPGLTVRSRTGFYGVTDDEMRVAPQVAGQRLVRAVLSPFGASGVHVSLAPVYGDDAKAGPTVRCFVHFDARDLTFVDNGGGARKVRLTIVVLLLNEYGVLRASDAHTHELVLPEAAYQAALRDGIDFAHTFPVERAGPYQVRAAVRDDASDRVGSDFQAVDAPDLKKGRLALSTLALGGKDGVTATDTAVRRFRRGDVLVYGFDVYNARLDEAAKAPRLQIGVRLYRDGEPVYTGPPQPLDVGPQADWQRIRAGRALVLGTEMQPGAYVLEVTVIDPLSKKKPNAVTQWVDFDVE